MVPGPTLKIGLSMARANGQLVEHCLNCLGFRNLKIVSECLGTSVSLLVLDEAKFSSYLCACIRHLRSVYAHARIQTRAHKHIHRPWRVIIVVPKSIGKALYVEICSLLLDRQELFWWAPYPFEGSHVPLVTWAVSLLSPLQIVWHVSNWKKFLVFQCVFVEQRS